MAPAKLNQVWIPPGQPTEQIAGKVLEIQVLVKYDTLFDHPYVKFSCNCTTYGRKIWCSHISEFFSSGVDVKFLQAKPLIVRVPFIRDPDISMFLLLEDENSLVRVSHVTSSSMLDATTVDWCLPEDGITHFRSMLVEWVYSLPHKYPDKMKCKTSFHSVGQSYLEREFVNSNPFKKGYLVDAYKLFTYNVCQACWEVKELPAPIPLDLTRFIGRLNFGKA